MSVSWIEAIRKGKKNTVSDNRKVVNGLATYTVKTPCSNLECEKVITQLERDL